MLCACLHLLFLMESNHQILQQQCHIFQLPFYCFPYQSAYALQSSAIISFKPKVYRKLHALKCSTISVNNAVSDASSISHLRVHPGIGIARFGNSPTEYFIGSEVPGHVSQPKDGLFKDNEGRVKRQAVRFRIYAYDSSDKVIKELTLDDCPITWQVHLTNRKSSSNEFTGFYVPPSSKKRNSDIVGEEEREERLVIDSGPISING